MAACSRLRVMCMTLRVEGGRHQSAADRSRTTLESACMRKLRRRPRVGGGKHASKSAIGSTRVGCGGSARGNSAGGINRDFHGHVVRLFGNLRREGGASTSALQLARPTAYPYPYRQPLSVTAALIRSLTALTGQSLSAIPSNLDIAYCYGPMTGWHAHASQTWIRTQTHASFCASTHTCTHAG